jgi:hypothetical protein
MTVVVAICAATVACKSNEIQEDNSQTTNNAGDVIGPEGGTLEDPVHHSKILFPAGAVPKATQFKLGVVEGVDAPSGQTLISPVFSFEPHGFTFHGPVTVMLPFTPTSGGVGVWHASCQGNACQAWDAAPISDVQLATGTATFLAPGFSLYAVTTSHASADDAGAPGPQPCGGACPAGAFCNSVQNTCVDCVVGASCFSSEECGICGLTCMNGQCAAK